MTNTDPANSKPSAPPFLKEGENCWRIETATYASLVIGVADYYRDLHESICKAKHSVFIVGWDMDSRIALVRGEDAAGGCPVTLYDLIVSKARENPDLQIYLNEWNHSLVFSINREFMPAVKWRKAECPNIHFRFDRIIPVHGSHHQKIIVVDDEVAYTGGIDIGLYRWDTREHKPEHSDRRDPVSEMDKDPEKSYLPNHDIQICVAGPAAKALGELVRRRWLMATDYEAIPLRQYEGTSGIPDVWPSSHNPDFKDVTVGISLTFPPIGDSGPIKYIERLYLDEISRAEKFIYIENQYLASYKIAAALNQKLKETPALRVLLYSSRDPAGLIEESTMWYKRIRFRKILQRGGVADRCEMIYSITTDGKKTLPLHVHAKLLIVDDKSLHIGSSNLNNRSMMLDTECDVIVLGENEQSRAKIADIRNDLIREHSGMERADIQALIDTKTSISDFLIDVPHSTQHIRKIRDSLNPISPYLRIITGLGEPKDHEIPFLLRLLSDQDDHAGFPHKKVSFGFLLIMLLALFFLAWDHSPASAYMTAEGLQDQMKNFSGSPYAIPAVMLIFILGGLVFMPVTVMIAATAAVFGPVTGFFLSMAGALASAFVTFMIGFFLGEKLFKNFANTAFLRISDRLKDSGVVGIAALRMIPLAPYTLVNMILGVSTVRLLPYLAGTFIGLLPGLITMAVLGDSLAQVLRSPNAYHMLYLGAGIVIWLAALAGIHWGVGRIQHKRGKAYV